MSGDTALRVARAVEEALREAEASRRSRGALLRHGIGSLVVAAAVWWLWPDVAMRPAVALAVAIEWGLFALAALLYRFAARSRGAYAVIDLLADSALSLCVITLLSMSHATPSLLWPCALAGGFLLGPRTNGQYVRRRVLAACAHAVLGVVFFARGDVAAAVFAFVVLSTVDVELWVLHGIFAHQTLARAERDVRRQELTDRLAAREIKGVTRELHDNVGAEITALIFSLRRAELAQPATEPHSPADQAQQVLRKLRRAVTALRALEQRVVN